MERKKSIRKRIFQLREGVPQSEIQESSRKIMHQITGLSLWQKASCIYAYMDFNKEVMTRELIETACRQGKRVAVPRVQGKEMHFYIITEFNQCEPGVFGIAEPKDGLPEADCEDALMIVPGVAFDCDRHRIGYGGGYYDRYLSVHKKHPTAAAAFSWQVLENIPCEPTDIRPDYLITEQTIYKSQI